MSNFNRSHGQVQEMLAGAMLQEAPREPPLAAGVPDGGLEARDCCSWKQ